jgi:cell wall-associated NlpC family hydrolase
MLRGGGLAALLCCAFACTAGATNENWAAPQIRAVTQAGVLGTSVASFSPQAKLDQSALAAAIAAVDALQHPAAPIPPQPALTTTVGADATIAGVTPVDLDVTGGGEIDHVDFAVDGTGTSTAYEMPYELDLDTTGLADGPHALAADVWFVDGSQAIATWQVTIANDDTTPSTAPGPPVPLPLAKWQPAQPLGPSAVKHALFRAVSPNQAVTVKRLDAALVAYLGLGKAAREVQGTLVAAGLAPTPNTGTEAIARMLGLRVNHPASQDALELLPNQAVTRAEGAYSLAQVLALNDARVAQAQTAADTFTLPTLTPWQQRILSTAVHYVGYPYIWGGTSPTAETLFGVHSVGGFDCSGFIWRVYKLTPYDGEGDLASVLVGRTTYQMSGEVPKSQRIVAANLQPADVMFFGPHGPKSKPSEVDHAAIYLGNGWFIQSSGSGVTLLPFAGYYADRFAWARRPLREAGLNG